MDLPELVQEVRRLVEAHAGCTEQDCGCIGSVLMNAVLEAEWQLAELARFNQANLAQNISNT